MDSSPVVLLFILFLSFPLSFSRIPNALVVPVTKDPSTLQYIAKVNQRTPLVSLKLVVDLGGQYLWVDCDKGYVSSAYRPVPCRSAMCSAANGFACSGNCPGKPGPGCNNNTCLVTPENPFTRITASRELATDVFSVRSTDGNKSGPAVMDPHFPFSCAPTFLFRGLARGTKGVIGLGRNKVTATQQLAATFGFQRTFAICLTSSTGFMFFGSSGPFIFQGPGLDVSKSLIYTPLLVNPVSTAESYIDGKNSPEYFIGVRSIQIDKKPIKLNGTLLAINKNGVGGTKISTVHPYTLLERSIYKAVLAAFGTAMSQIQAKRVAPVSPFGLCFDAVTIQSTRVGYSVPSIYLMLQSNSVYWRIDGTNSLIRVGNNGDVLCLGFVDPGINPTTSIVIGGYQLEDNLLLFDLARSRLGFSNSLIVSRTSCANFYY